MIENVERQQVWFFLFDCARVGDKFSLENVASKQPSCPQMVLHLL